MHLNNAAAHLHVLHMIIYTLSNRVIVLHYAAYSNHPHIVTLIQAACTQPWHLSGPMHHHTLYPTLQQNTPLPGQLAARSHCPPSDGHHQFHKRDQGL